MGEAIARLKQLRNCFERAKKRLESLPECGLSEAGQPYIQEVADALQSFAGWFCNLTFDDMGLSGSARRIHVAAAAFDAIVDWVGLHRSQQFASDISGQMAELVEQSQALDDAVMSAFLVERTPNSVTYRTSAFVPQAKQEAIEYGIQSVASLAGHLGVRLQRIAIMVDSRSDEKKPAAKKARKRSRKGIGGRPAKFTVKFIREMVAARERDEKHAAKARKPLTSISEWLSDYFTNVKKLPLSTLPPKDPKKPEEWSIRAGRFWKAAKTRLSRDEN